MLELFIEGGVLFMSILTLVALVMLSVAVVNGVAIFSGGVDNVANSRHRLGYIKSVGLFALVTGLLGQLIGLYSAFQYIEAAGSVSPAMLAGGLKVSSITSLYGMLIFVISYLLWFLLDVSLNRQ
jgi:hypothetical protein